MDDEHTASILLRIKPWLESGGPFPSAADKSSATEEEDLVSALDLRDRVVVELLQEGRVEERQVEQAWERWKSEHEDTPDALWRVVARLPEVETEAVFAQAARVYAYESATSLLPQALSFLRTHRKRFSLVQRRQFVALGVLPVTIEETSAGSTWVFATHDPDRYAVHALLSELDVSAYDLRYAPAEAVRKELRTAFPGVVVLESDSLQEEPSEAETSRQKPESGSQSGARLENNRASAVRQEDQEEPGKRPGRRGTTLTFASIYEDLIAGLAQSEATRVRLVSDEERVHAVFDYSEGEKRRVKLEVLPEAVLSFMRRRLHSTRHTSSSQAGRRLHRWVEGSRHSFHISELPRRSAWTAGRGEILIEDVT